MQPEQEADNTQDVQRMEAMPNEQTVEPVPSVPSNDIGQIYMENSASSGYTDDALAQSQLENDMMQGQRDEGISQNQQDAGADLGQPMKKFKMMLFGMIAAMMVAVLGIGFGIWTLVNGNSEKEQYESKISDLTKQNSTLKKKLEKDDSVIVETEVSEKTEVESEPENDVDTAEYIYIGEWGLKIKIPEGLNYVSYGFKQNIESDQVESSTVAVSGTVGSGLSDFANLYKNNSSLGAVMRVRKGAYEGAALEEPKDCMYSSLVFSDEEYNYCFSGSQAVFSTDRAEQDLEVESTGLIRQMLQDKNNYSKI